MSTNQQKTAGITLIAIYSALTGLLSLFAGLVFSLFSAIPEIPLWASLLSFVFIIFGALLLASVYGLWTLQSWGWQFTFWLYLISIPLGFISIFPIFPGDEMSAGNTIFQLIGIAISIAVIMYLKKYEIQARYNVF